MAARRGIGGQLLMSGKSVAWGTHGLSYFLCNFGRNRYHPDVLHLLPPHHSVGTMACLHSVKGLNVCIYPQTASKLPGVRHYG
jgi:hypothetical protein